MNRRRHWFESLRARKMCIPGRSCGYPDDMTQTPNVIDTQKTHGDLVSQLLAQHELVRAAIDKVVKTTTADARQEAFDELRELLARHETAEEMIVRPLTRGIDEGEAVAEARMNEENTSKDELVELERLDIDSEEFA